MSTAPPLSLSTVIFESKRIIKAHSRHFLALSVLFLLPLSFSITVYPTLQQLLLNSTRTNAARALLRHVSRGPTSAADQKALLLVLSYSLFLFVFSLCAVGSITYSVFHGFYGRPVKFISAIKSILTSFFPLLFTTIVSQTIVFGVTALFAVFLLLAVRLVNFFGFHFEYTSPYFSGFALVFLVGLLVVLFYLQVNWLLASVVVVVESSWGFTPLKRSASLIKGYRLVALSFYLCYSLLIGGLIWSYSFWLTCLGNLSDAWRSWGFVFQYVFISTLLTLLFLQYLAANTVLYIYCKAIHGELATEIAEEFAEEYVSLPFDDGKVPHLVSVVYTT